MPNCVKLSGLLILVVASVVGCSETNPPGAVKSEASGPVSGYLLADKPADVRGVEMARKDSQGGEEIAVEGRIGGSEQPFVEGIAAFTIVDTSLKWCAEDEGCPTPWDYCCSDTASKIAMVKVVGPDGRPVGKDARELLGVKELSLVVARGKVKRDEQANLTLLAERIHVVKQ